jgi:ferric-chelate reductase
MVLAMIHYDDRSVASIPNSPSYADILLKVEHQAKYVKELWLFLASIIALLTVVNVISKIVDGISPPKSQAKEQYASSSGHGRFSLRRLPAAIASSFKIIAFRVTVPIGPSSVTSVTEIIFILGYIIALITWLFVDSTYTQ